MVHGRGRVKLEFAQPAERAYGFISNWVAPACPALSGLPAVAMVPIARKLPVSATLNDLFKNDFILYKFNAIIKISNSVNPAALQHRTISVFSRLLPVHPRG